MCVILFLTLFYQNSDLQSSTL